MNSLRQFLLIVVLLFAQVTAGVHAVEHAADDREGLPTHACELCLAVHDLGVALPSLAVLPALSFAHQVPEVIALAGRSAFPPPVASQRGPPSL